jgi:hypothetical protein
MAGQLIESILASEYPLRMGKLTDHNLDAVRTESSPTRSVQHGRKKRGQGEWHFSMTAEEIPAKFGKRGHDFDQKAAFNELNSFLDEV